MNERPTFISAGKNYLLVIAVLLERLGTPQTLTQADIDRVAYNYVDETFNMDRTVTFALRQREAQS